MMLNKEEIWRLSRAVHPLAIEVRRHLHQYPELSFQEKETSAYLTAQLEAMGCAVQTGVGGYGLKVVIGGKPGRTVALRGDMDALPIQEETGLPYASSHPGVMHACGHDVHTATLLATASALKQVEADLSGQVVLLFQPGEEVNPGGASLMIRDGALQNPMVDAIFGLHVSTGETVGSMGFCAGPVNAAPDEFDVTIIGRGGHGAAPHLAVDPVMIAAQVLTLLQQIVARNVSPFERAVITVGSIHGGTARNVIPDEVTFKGTVRTASAAVRDLMEERIGQLVRGVCEAGGATYKLHYDRGYPVLVNDQEATALAREAAEAVLGPDNLLTTTPTMGGEDFAYFAEQVPGSFARLGASAPGAVNPAGVHTSRLVIDEECMAVGVAYYLSVVQRFLGQNTSR